MKADQIKDRGVYEISLGKTPSGEVKKTVVKVVGWNPKTKSWACKTESGKDMSIKDAKRFLKEVKPKEEKAKEVATRKGPAPKQAPKEKAEPVLKVSEAEAERLKKVAQEAGRKAAIAKQAFDNGLVTQKVLDEAMQEAEDAKDALVEAGVKVGRSLGMMGGKEAAFRVLQEEGKPMRAKELCQIAHDRGYCNMPGKTPWATIAAAIVTDINEKGDKSKFKKTAPGLFAVNEKYKEEK